MRRAQLLFCFILYALLLSCRSQEEQSCRAGQNVCGIVAYFNIAKFQSRKRNFDIFRSKSKQQGLWLLVVELAFDDDVFELQPQVDADTLIHVRGSRLNNAMWQKERLLNIGISQAPQWCEAFVWPDAEILFDRSDWIHQLEQALQAFDVLQPFEYAVRLSKGQDTIDTSSAPVSKSKAEQVKTVGFARAVTQFSPNSRSRQRVLASQREHGYTGFVWAARKDFLLASGGLFDQAIVGGGDALMAHGYLAHVQDQHQSVEPYYYAARFGGVDCAQKKAFHSWTSRVRSARVGFIPGTVLHLWHGSKADRQYTSRHEILRSRRFDPERDIKKQQVHAVLYNASGSHDLHVSIWQWDPACDQSLRQAVLEMFQTRAEDT